MTLADLVLLALRALRRNALRSALTMLGIVIGVGAVIAMVTMGAGVTQQVGESLSRLGTNLILVRPGEAGAGARAEAAPFGAADADAIAREVPEAQAVAPVESRPLQAIAGDRNRLTTVTGSTHALLDVRAWTFANGRGFSDGEERAGAAVCVLGATVRSDLFGGEDPTDRRIRIGSRTCRVAGTLAPKGASSFGADQDDFVLVPLRWFQRQLVGNSGVRSLYVSARADVATGQLARDVAQVLRERRRIQRGSDDFSIRDMTEIASAALGTTQALTRFVAALAAVSMFVGGIGIMNIMLVSVTERTQEIGIRLAVGARERDVQRQFLTESAVLTSLGGVVGIALGTAAGVLGTRVLHVPFVPQTGVVIAAFAVSAAVGLCFGYYPARRAAHLDPITSLQYE
ncbi:MAG TPA: ABC transporter permease [Myxococcota bacterium]|nr:ABC transporter permease [Myxococcota bacterium]